MQDYITKAAELSEHVEFTNGNGNASECTEASAEDLLNYFKEFLVEKCKHEFEVYLSDPQNPWPDLGYGGKEENDYSKQETDNLYFCKYGIAYAFEYAMLYEIMLSIYDDEQFGVFSFGSGGFIDAWALAYARAKLREEKRYKNLSLFYQGVDIVPWKTRVFGNIIDEKWPENGSNDADNSGDYFDNISIPYGDTECVVSGFRFRKPQLKGIQEFAPKMYYNVLMFPKILNELDDDVLDDFIKKLSEFKEPNKQRDYYLCVSHSPYDLKKGAVGTKAVAKIVKMFKEKGFECEDDLQVLLNDEELYEKLRDKYKIEKEYNEDISDYKYYIVGGKSIYIKDEKKYNIGKEDDDRYKKTKKYDTYINEIHGGYGFECETVRNYLSYLDEKDKRADGEKCNQMRKADIAFQIIRFTKEDK